VIEFLKALQATIGKKLLIIWDRLQAHRSKLVRAHVDLGDLSHHARPSPRSMQSRSTRVCAFWQQA